MNKKIPKPTLDNKKPFIDIQQDKHLRRGKKGVSFSFEALEFNEYFNLNGTCQNWTYDLMQMLKDVSTHTVDDLRQNKFKTFRVHNHINANPPCDIPQGIELKDFYQIRISKSKGGIHGVFYEDTFYVIWLDPLHNMYPDDRYGGLRKIVFPSTCCRERENEISNLKGQLENAKNDIKDYEELINDLEDKKQDN